MALKSANSILASKNALTCLAAEVVSAKLRDGRPVILRTIQPSDEVLMREGIEQLSPNSRYLRFFSPQPVPSDAVIQNLVDADSYNHIAWGALLADSLKNPAIGAVHVFRDSEESSRGELSFAIVDDYHGLGLARMLMAVLLVHCRVAKIEKLDIHVLSENRAAANLVRTLGALRSSVPSSVSDYMLDVELGLQNLRSQADNEALQDVFECLIRYL